MLHLIDNGHTYVHIIIITIPLFLHSSYILFGRPVGPDPSRREQNLCEQCVNVILIVYSTVN
jgi:hypothetical protein